jgi:hypothetical protein
LWEVFGQEQGFEEYQYIAPHPDLPVDGHNAVKPVKTEKKALRKNKKDIASLRVSFSGVFTVDAMIEGTIDDAGMWPYGRIHLALVVLYETYRPKSRLDRIQLDMDKLTIKMDDSDHPDVLSELAMMVRKKYRRRRTKPTWDELISCIVTGSSLFYQTHFTTMMLRMDHEEDGQIVMNAMKQLGNELYTASHLSQTNVESAHETSLMQFKKKQQDQWTQGMQCYWCWKLGHKSADCSRRQAGQPKLPRPGSTITGAPRGGGNNNNNNNSDGGGKSLCTRCKGQHHTNNCYHDPANAAKRPKGWLVGGIKKEFGTVLIDAGVHKPDFLIIATEHDCSIDSSIIDSTIAKDHDCSIDSSVFNSTIAKEHESNELVPNFSLVAIDSLTVFEARPAIDAQLLLIQDQVNNGQMSFPDNFELLYDKNVWILHTGASCNSSGCMDGAVNIRDDNSEVIPANGVCIKQDKIGDIPCSKLDKFGNHVNYT